MAQREILKEKDDILQKPPKESGKFQPLSTICFFFTKQSQRRGSIAQYPLNTLLCTTNAYFRLSLQHVVFLAIHGLTPSYRKHIKSIFYDCFTFCYCEGTMKTLIRVWQLTSTCWPSTHRLKLRKSCNVLLP